MSTVDVVRAWKDCDYRRSLTAEQLRALPPNPVRLAQITREQMDEVEGYGVFSEHGESLLIACCGVTKIEH